MQYKRIKLVDQTTKEEVITIYPYQMLRDIQAPSFGEAPSDHAIRLPIRSDGEFAGKAIYLSSNYDWILGRDDLGLIILIPLIKAPAM